jgi:hypothetical protein
MKAILTTLACTGMLMAGAAFASGPNSPSSSSANPSPPASQTTTAAPARTARSGESTMNSTTKDHSAPHSTAMNHETRSERIATREMCHKAADQKGLTGTARTNYLHSCHLVVVPR